jgi:hypothetical protein
MSDQKNFLERWSRRKLETGAAPAEKAALATSEENSASAAAADSPPVPEFDLKSLPSVESIGAASDVRAFLQRGVPPALTRAALRRAWSSDPAIRDFIGLSENSWDFNATDSMRGFGPLDPEEVRKLAAQFFAGQQASAPDQNSEVASADRSPLVQTASIARESEVFNAHEMRKANLNVPEASRIEQVQDVENSDKKADVIGSGKQPIRDAAPQYKEKDDEYDRLSLPRRHGGALPE